MSVTFWPGDGLASSALRDAHIFTLQDDDDFEAAETIVVQATVVISDSPGQGKGLFDTGAMFGSTTATASITIVSVLQGERM